jgi:hypothetical protein
MVLVLLLAAAPYLPPPGVRCQSYEEPSLRRWHTICADGTRAISTWNGTLGRWDTTVTPPAGQRPERRQPLSPRQ